MVYFYEVRTGEGIAGGSEIWDVHDPAFFDLHGDRHGQHRDKARRPAPITRAGR